MADGLSALLAGANPLQGGTATTPQYLPPDFLNQLLAPLVGNQMAGLNLQAALAPSQIQNIQDTAAMQGRQAGQEAGWGQRQLDISQTTGVDIPRQQLANQRGLSNTLWGLSQQAAPLQRQLQVDMPTAAAQRQQALESSQFGLTQQGEGLTRQELGLQGESLAEQQQQLDYNSRRALQNAMGGQAARGATTSIGAARELEDLAKQKGWSQQDLDRAKAQLGISQSREGLTEQGAALTHGEAQAGIADQLKQLGIGGQLFDIGQQQAGAQHTNELAGMDLQGKGIDAVAAGLGLSRDELTGRLQNTLQQLGLQSQMAPTDVLSGLASQTMGQFTPTAGLVNQTAQLGLGRVALPSNLTPAQLSGLIAPTPAPAPAPAPKPAAPAPVKAPGGTRSGQQP